AGHTRPVPVDRLRHGDHPGADRLRPQGAGGAQAADAGPGVLARHLTRAATGSARRPAVHALPPRATTRRTPAPSPPDTPRTRTQRTGIRTHRTRTPPGSVPGPGARPGRHRRAARTSPAREPGRGARSSGHGGHAAPSMPPPAVRPRPPYSTRPAPVRTAPASAPTAPVRPPGPYRAPARGPDVTGARPGRHRRASRAGTRDHRGMDVTLHLAQDPE